MFCKNRQGFFWGTKPPQDRTKNIKHKIRNNVQFKKKQSNQKLA